MNRAASTSSAASFGVMGFGGTEPHSHVMLICGLNQQPVLSCENSYNGSKMAVAHVYAGLCYLAISSTLPIIYLHVLALWPTFLVSCCLFCRLALFPFVTNFSFYSLLADVVYPFSLCGRAVVVFSVCGPYSKGQLMTGKHYRCIMLNSTQHVLWGLCASFDHGYRVWTKWCVDSRIWLKRKFKGPEYRFLRKKCRTAPSQHC